MQGGHHQQATEIGLIAYFSLISSSLLLLPIVLLLINRQLVQPWLETGKQFIEVRSSLILGLLRLALAVYLGWSGWTGLGQFTTIS